MVLLAEERAILDEWIAWRVVATHMRPGRLLAPLYSKILVVLLLGGHIYLARVKGLSLSRLLTRALKADPPDGGEGLIEKALGATWQEVTILDAPFEYSFVISAMVTMLLQVEADGTCTEDGAFLVYDGSGPMGSSICTASGASVFEYFFDPLPSESSHAIVVTDSLGASTITGYIAAYVIEAYDTAGSIVDAEIDAGSSSNIFLATLDEGEEKMVLVTGSECTTAGDFALYNSFTLVATSTCSTTSSISAVLSVAGLQEIRIESSLGDPVEVQFSILLIVAYSESNVVVPFGS